MEQMIIKIDKTLDLLTASIPDKKSNGSNLEVIEIENNILFHIDSLTNEVVMVQIYDYSIIKRKFFKHFLLLITKDAIRTWLNTLIASFSANKHNLAYPKP